MIRHNDFEEAVRLLEPVRSRVMASPGLDITLARAYIGAGKPGKAIDLLNALQRGDPSWRTAYLLGLAYVSDKRPESAVAAFRDSLRLNPDQADGHFRLGKLLLDAANETDQQAGLQELHQAIALDPHTSEHYEVLGRWLLQRDKLKEAIEVLDQGIKNGTPSAELEAMMGLAQAALHGGASAKPFAEKALQQDSRMALAHYLVGFCYFNAGDYAHAMEYYKQAATLDPGDDLFYYDTALALQRLNRVSEALPYAQKSTELNPGRSLNHYFLGKLYTRLNRNAEAVPELEASIRLNPQLDNSYYLLSQIYERSGDTTKAQEMRDKLAQLKHARDRGATIESPDPEAQDMISPSRVLQNRNQPQ
jgi:tetratricopeptide (TPR) repeat protein